MTQKVQLDFVITAQSVGVQQEIKRLNSALMGMAQSAKGPQAVNAALKQQMTLHQANINAIQGHAAAIMTLSNASTIFTKNMQKGNVSFKDARHSLGQLSKAYRVSSKSAQGFSQQIRNVAKEQLQFQSANFTSFLRNMDGQLTGVANTTNHFGRTLVDAKGKTAQFRMEQFLGSKQLEAYGKNMVKAGKDMQWSGRQITMGFTMPLALAGGALALFANEVDKNLTRIVKVYNFAGNETEAEMNRLKDASRSLATEVAANYGFAVSETLGVMAEFAQQGRVGQELMQMTEETMRVSFLGDVDTDNATRLIRMLEQSADIVNGININPSMDELASGVARTERTFQDLNTTLNRFNYLENNTVITVADLAEELPDLVGTLNSLNLSVEFGAAALTGMKEAGLNVNEAQTALRTGFQRLVSPSQKAVDTFREFTGKDLNALAEGATSAEEVISSLADELRNLDDFNAKADVLSSIFGNRQSGRLSLLFDQIGRENSAFTEAIDITGGFGDFEGVSELEAYRTALEETGRVQDSLSGKVERAKARFGDLAASLGETFLPVVIRILNAGSKFVEWLDSWPDKLKSATIMVSLLAGGFGLLIQVTGTLRNLLGNFIALVSGFTSRSAGGWLKTMNLDAKIFENTQASVNHKMQNTTELMAQQTQQALKLQQALAASQGHVLSGPGATKSNVAAASTALQSKASSARVALWKNAIAQQQTNLALVREERIAHEAVGNEKREQLALLDAEIAKNDINAATAKENYHAQKLVVETKREALRIAAAEASAQQTISAQKQREYAAEIASLQVERQSATTKKAKAEIDKKIGVLQAKQTKEQNKIDRSKASELAATEKLAAAEAKRATLLKQHQSAGSAARKKKLADQRAALAAEVKLLNLDTTAAKLLKQEALTEEKIAKIKASVTKVEFEQLQAKIQAVRVAEQELRIEERQVGAAEKQLALTKQQSAEKRSMRFKGGAAGGGIGAALMMGSMVGSGGGSATSMAAGAMLGTASMGFMFGGLPGAFAGLALGAWQARDSIAEVGRSLGLLPEKIESVGDSVADLSDIFKVPAQNNPFAGTVHGIGSLAREEQFKNSDEFKALEDKYGESGSDDFKMDDFNRDIAATFSRSLLAGVDEAELRAELQAGLDAVGSDLKLTELSFDISQRNFGADFVDNINSIMRQEGQSLGVGIGDGFSLGLEAFMANNGELATDAINEVLDYAFENVSTDNRNLLELAGVHDGMFEVFEALFDEVITYDSLIEQLELRSLETIYDPSTDTTEVTKLAENAQELLVIIENLKAAGMGDEDIFNIFSGTASEASKNAEVIGDVVQRLGLKVEGEIKTIEELFQVIGSQKLGNSAAAEFKEVFDGLMTTATSYGNVTDETTQHILRQAFELVFLKESAKHAADGFNELTEAQQESINSWVSAYRSLSREAFTDAGSEFLMAPFREAKEEELEIFDERAEALREFHSERQDELKDAQQEESRILSEAQQERTEAVKDAQREELEAFDERAKGLIESAKAAADGKIAALDAEEAAVNELDEERKRSYEDEVRRQEYFAGLRNKAMSLSIAMASGDVERATQLRGEMDSDTSAYVNEESERQIEAAREAEREAREAKKDEIRSALEDEVELIEEKNKAERKELEKTHELKLKQLEAEQRVITEALKERQELESKQLQKRLKAESDALAEEKQNSAEAADARIEAGQEALDFAIKVVNPKTIEDWDNVVDTMNQRLVDTGNEGFVGSVEQAGLIAGVQLAKDLDDAVMLAGREVASDREWGDFGENMADHIARGMFSDMPINSVDDLIRWIDTGRLSTPSSLPNSAGHQIPVNHSGGPISGTMNRNRSSNIPLKPGERPIIAQDGEYMIRKSAVQKLGTPFLNQLNSAGMGKGMQSEPPRFHTGGIIGGMGMAAMLPMLGLVRTMGEAGGQMLTDEGLAGFAETFGVSPGGAGQMSVGAGGIDAFMAAIKQKESGGNYNAYNPSGATGAYQILRVNWPSWAENAGLPRNAAWTPENQDLVARTEMLRLFNAFNNNWGAVAASWYGGPGAGRRYVDDPNQRYITRKQYSHGREYPSIADYVAAVMSAAQISAMPTAGFGPFVRGLTAPDHFAPWLTDSQRDGVLPEVMHVVGRVLAGIPGGQQIISGFRSGSIVAGTDRLSNHAFGRAVDIGALARSEGGTIESERMGDSIAAAFRSLPLEIRPSEVLWKTWTGGNHYNHVHAGWRNPPQIGMPSLMTGGKVMYDNTIANLHAGEAVLTKPLTDKLERGINNMSSSSVINIYAQPGMDEERLASHVIRKIQQREMRQGVRPSAK